MKELDFTEKFENSIKKIQKKDKPLFAEIYKKIELLRNEKDAGLDLKPIIRKNGKHQIQEIVIRYPSNVRVFYVVVKVENDKILLVDVERKKVNAFPQSYFKTLDKCIDNHFKN